MQGVKTISADVEAVLRRATILEDRIVLADEQLDRKLYAAVNDVLVGYGGKWHKGQKAHLFASDPRLKLKAVLVSGKVVNEKQHLGAFYTPLPLVRRMVELAELKSLERVLEPSAGDGRIAQACRDEGCLVACCEIDPDRHTHLTMRGFPMVGFDFLLVPPPSDAYDAVLMNPPFAGFADILHVRHAFQFVGIGGRLIAIMSAGFTFRRDRKSVDFLAFVEAWGEYEHLPEATFRESGTSVNTVLVQLRRD